MRDATSCPPADAELSVAALRYAAGDMTPAEAEAFEARLGSDQTARDALAEAVRLSAAASGAPEPTPDPLARKAVAERLHPTWLTRLFPRRPYRGHPAVWTGLGGVVAAMVAFAVASQAPSPQPVQVAGVGRLIPFNMSTAVPVDPTAEELAAVVQPPVQLAAETPTSPKLNPMGMEKRPNDTLESAAFPTPVITPMPTCTVPVGPQPRSAADKIAEGPGDQNPMGDPQIGMTNS